MLSNHEVSLRIRPSVHSDLNSIHAIYEEQVLNGVSSWEEIPPTLEEMQARRDAILDKGYPYLVAELDGEVMGYTYASAYRPRSGYRYTVEHSIYVGDKCRKSGVGRALLTELIHQCEALGYRQMIAVIGDSNNHQSIEFHKRMGFEHIGTFKSIGYKFNRWMDSVLMQRTLGDGGSSEPA